VNPNVTPTFNAVAPICAGATLSALPTTSTNGITGTWSPALNNTATTTYTFTPSAGQCATTSTLTITVNPNFSSVQNITQCSGLSYTFPDGTTYVNITANQTYVSLLSTVSGCDSAITTNITVVSGFTINENISLCAGNNYTFPDGTVHTNITANETYVSNLISSGGCDSTITTNISVQQVYALNENISVCEGDVYTFPDGFSTSIVNNTTHVSNLVSGAGCDSIITTQITMIAIANTTVNQTVCANTNYVFPDGSSHVVNANMSQVSTLVSSLGCDSIVTTNLTVIQVSQQVENITLCVGADYTFPDGVTHTNIQINEQYQSNFTGSQGCDSIWITNITVVPLPNVNAGNNIAVCEGTSFTLNATGANSYTWDQGMVNGIPNTLNPGTYVFHVTGTSADGCLASDSLEVIVYATPSPQISVNLNNGCAPLNVVFTASGINPGGLFDWNFGNGLSGTGNPVAANYSASGIYDVSLTYTDANGCTAIVTANDLIEVFPTPDAAFTFSPQQPDVLNPEVVFQNNSTGANNYVWYFGDSTQSTEINPTHMYPGQAGSYTVTLVASNGGCTDSVQLVVTIQDIVLFYVPNAFAPDADGKNDVFIPVFSSGIDPEDYHLMIFNRWGELIFETHNTTQGWDGHHKGQGPVKDDVYVWKIEFKETMSAKRQVLYGHVTLIK
jgi:gliding motility-associated-like protein